MLRQERNNIFYNIDWLLVLLYFLLVGFGWMNIYATSLTDVSISILNFSTSYGKQLWWLILCIPLIIAVLFLNAKFYERFASVFYLIAIASLLGLFFFGKRINGATSWYYFSGIGIQPSEFAKVFTAMAVAKLLSDRKYDLKILKNQIKAFVIIFVPFALITLQPDPGSSLIYLAFFFVLNREGLPLKYIVFGLLAVVFFIITLFFGVKSTLFACGVLIIILSIYLQYRDKYFFRFNWLKIIGICLLMGGYILSSNYVYNDVFEQRHRDRFDILLGKKKDTKNIGYNLHQSELTISSGGFWGKGFLQGDRTKGKFVPEQHTDYIFSTVGEEWGFIGTSAVIILFMILLYRILYLSETHTNKFGRIYGYGIASILFFHLTINIGMVIGLLPTIGVPLPFFSYGGSSLWGFTLLLFIFIRLDAHKSFDL